MKNILILNVQCLKFGIKMSEARNDEYGYNTRSELISASKDGINEYAYNYDDIGNGHAAIIKTNAITILSAA